MPSIQRLKQEKRQIIARYSKAENVKGFAQIATTLIPLAALWYGALLSTRVSYWITAAIALVMTLFLLRVFVLMHECGHGSLFRTCRLNKAFGFALGVVAGMPQYVWSEHHSYHHSTNGNWAKYRGPLTTASVDEYAAMSVGEQRRYESSRELWLAPLAGFVYLIANPRYTWLKGNVALACHVIKQMVAEPRVSIATHVRSFKTRYWKSSEEYRHMSWNNLAVLSGWALMSYCVGPRLFFSVYIVSMSLAGAAGLVLFTVQHNFEHAYASADEGWDYDAAAIHGTSFLLLPWWLNWFTANIAYHHIHHLSANIPNYCLVNCHEEFEHLFTNVPRIKLSAVRRSLKHILWDERARRIISIAEYHSRANGTPV